MIEVNMKCRKCGFIQSWHNTKRFCPKCGTLYKDYIHN